MKRFQSTPYTFNDLSERARSELVIAEESAWKANRRREHLVSRVTQELSQRNASRRMPPPTDAEIKSVTNKYCSESPDWSSNVSANRWHLDQATAFGIAALVAAEQEARDAPRNNAWISGEN